MCQHKVDQSKEGDDIYYEYLQVLSNPSHTSNSVKQAAGNVFRVKVESVHSVPSDFVFLDLSAQFVAPRVRILASQSKPVIPLCASSAHNPGVHKSWPMAVAS